MQFSALKLIQNGGRCVCHLPRHWTLLLCRYSVLNLPLKIGCVQGWMRKGDALFGLQDFEGAAEAFDVAVALLPGLLATDFLLCVHPRCYCHIFKLVK